MKIYRGEHNFINTSDEIVIIRLEKDEIVRVYPKKESHLDGDYSEYRAEQKNDEVEVPPFSRVQIMHMN